MRFFGIFTLIFVFSEREASFSKVPHWLTIWSFRHRCYIWFEQDNRLRYFFNSPDQFQASKLSSPVLKLTIR
jgi:hypothetical protein